MILGMLQARMSSTRLPGKVMRDLLGRPMIDRQIERLRRAESLDRLVVATSDDASDDPLAEHLEREGVDVFRGPLTDVLARFSGALERFGPAEHVVRLTADCPLADWRVLDQVVRLHLAEGNDYTSNDLVRTFPHGLDVEIVRAEALQTAASEAVDPAEREHVTPFVYNRPDRFKLGCLTQAVDRSAERWTVDTPNDFAFVQRVYERLYPANPAFTSEDVLALDCRHGAEDA
ncbi:MAG: glycosyltransferase family protein [Proteobacteria bacterium]|nr:glycosyltransferase family protein [Pseudomonadota bacterium]